MCLKLVLGHDEKDDELDRRVIERVELNAFARAAKSSHHFVEPIRGTMGNGNSETDAGAHRFLALFECRQNPVAVFWFDLTARDQQIHQLDDRVPAFRRFHLWDDLFGGKKLSQGHADSSGAGSLAGRPGMTRVIWGVFRSSRGGVEGPR